MAILSVPQTESICDIVYAGYEVNIPDDSTDVDALLEKMRTLVGDELMFDLELAINLCVGNTQEAAFKLGWQLRSQV